MATLFHSNSKESCSCALQNPDMVIQLHCVASLLSPHAHARLLPMLRSAWRMLQSESEQRPHKLSYHVSVKGDAAEKAVSELENKLKAAGMCHLGMHANKFS